MDTFHYIHVMKNQQFAMLREIKKKKRKKKEVLIKRKRNKNINFEKKDIKSFWECNTFTRSKISQLRRRVYQLTADFWRLVHSHHSSLFTDWNLIVFRDWFFVLFYFLPACTWILCGMFETYKTNQPSSPFNLHTKNHSTKETCKVACVRIGNIITLKPAG